MSLDRVVHPLVGSLFRLMIDRHAWQDSSLRSRLRRAGCCGAVPLIRCDFSPYGAHSCARIWHKASRAVNAGVALSGFARLVILRG